MVTSQNLQSKDRYRLNDHTKSVLHKLAVVSTGNEVVSLTITFENIILFRHIPSKD